MQKCGYVTCDFTEVGDDNVKTNCIANIGFTRDDIFLKPGEYLELHIRINRPNWTNYVQSNDFSLNPESKTEYEYNTKGYLTKVSYPDGSTRSGTYDSRGNLLTVIDGNGDTTTFAYDDINRLTKYTDGNGYTTTYAYSATGQINRLWL